LDIAQYLFTGGNGASTGQTLRWWHAEVWRRAWGRVLPRWL